ncbi:unnamed protein product, partial [Sphagnum tenellum]
MSIIIGIAKGLAYLHHECNPTIVHLDINPQNILLDKNYTPKLGDFGLAKILDGSNENMITLASTSTPGKRGYMAPEILTSKEASPKSDVYSFGVLLMHLVNEIPFILDGDEIDIYRFIKWAQKVRVQKDGFKDIIDYVVINNSIVGFNHNEAKLILQISLKCIQ